MKSAGIEYMEMLKDERKDKVEMFPCLYLQGRMCEYYHFTCRMWVELHCQLYDDYKMKKEE